MDGKTYRKAAGPMDFSIFRPDDRTLMVAHDDLLRKMLANRAKPTEGKMTNVLKRIAEPPDALAVLLVEPIRPLIAGSLAMVPVPPPLADLKKVPDLLNSVGAKVNLTGNMAMSLTLRATDEEAAEQLQQIIDNGIAMGRQTMLAQMTARPAGDDPLEQAMVQYSKRASDRMMQSLRPCARGSVDVGDRRRQQQRPR